MDNKTIEINERIGVAICRLVDQGSDSIYTGDSSTADKLRSMGILRYMAEDGVFVPNFVSHCSDAHVELQKLDTDFLLHRLSFMVNRTVESVSNEYVVLLHPSVPEEMDIYSDDIFTGMKYYIFSAVTLKYERTSKGTKFVLAVSDTAHRDLITDLSGYNITLLSITK